MRNFVAELKSFIQSIDEPTDMPRYEARKPKSKKYNIHKRSLPAGVDIPIFFGVTKNESELLISQFLKSKVLVDEQKDKTSVLYYDVIATDAPVEEYNIFFNDRPLTTVDQ